MTPPRHRRPQQTQYEHVWSPPGVPTGPPPPQPVTSQPWFPWALGGGVAVMALFLVVLVQAAGPITPASSAAGAVSAAPTAAVPTLGLAQPLPPIPTLAPLPTPAAAHAAAAPDTDTYAIPEARTESTSSAATTVTLPRVKGRNGAVVVDELRELGLTKVDLASADDDHTVVLLPQNWTVVKIEPAAGTKVRTGQTVVVTMTKD